MFVLAFENNSENNIENMNMAQPKMSYKKKKEKQCQNVLNNSSDKLYHFIYLVRWRCCHGDQQGGRGGIR